MDRTTELIRKAHEGDQEARTRLVEENVGLVWCIVRRYSGRGTEAEDLFQIGSIGLLKAIDKFDLAYDVRFSTYAVPMISGEIRRFHRTTINLLYPAYSSLLSHTVSPIHLRLLSTVRESPP